MEKLFLLIGCAIAANFAMAQPFTVPALPYAYDALEPSIDNETMILHHDKHHAAYVKNLNDEATKDVRLKNLSLEIICKNVSMYSMAVRNNAGGHYNHSLFWTILSPQGGAPTGKLMEDIYTKYGSLDNFKSQFSDSAKTRFGSGWAWLIVLPNGEIKITTTPNQDNPLMDVAKEKGTPILALDVWEHAYYLKYRNVRPDYIKAFWEVVNWEQVSNLYKEALDNIADQQAVNKNKKMQRLRKNRVSVL